MMDREFTPREKGMLLVLAVLLLALGYMKLFYAPVQQAVEDNQQRQTELQDQALIEQTRALKMQVMEKELEELKAGNAVPDAQVPDYDNVQRVMIELNAILARAQEYSLAFDDVSLDDSGLVRRPVELTFKEYSLLHFFLEHPEEVLARERIMKAVWDTDDLLESRTIDMHVRTLRQKLGHAGDAICTVRKVGYKLSAKGTEAGEDA